MPAHRILIVDDDANLLKSFKRILGARFETITAANGADGLRAVKEQGPFTVAISDYKMPGMNGLEFFTRAGETDPRMVRILLTGFADLDMSLKALNEVDVFRLLTKPCPPKIMAKALFDAVGYHEAMAAEREMMDTTLKACVGMLADLISLLKPDVYSRVSRVLHMVRCLARTLGAAGDWEIETAVLLSMVGFVSLPPKVVEKVLKGRELNPLEAAQFEEHPAFAARFISKVPRMEGVSRIVAYQEKHFDGSGSPDDEVKGADIPLGARILKVAVDYDTQVSNFMAKGDALTLLLKRKGTYDPLVLDALTDFIGDEARYTLRKYFLHGLAPGMILAENLMGVRGGKRTKLLAKGQELSALVIDYLQSYAKHGELEEPVSVIEPLSCNL